MSLRLKGQRTHNQGDKSCWILSQCILGYQDHGHDFMETHSAKTSRYKLWICNLLTSKQISTFQSVEKEEEENRYKAKQSKGKTRKKGKQEKENERGLLQCELYGGADYVLHNYSHILAERGLYPLSLYISLCIDHNNVVLNIESNVIKKQIVATAQIVQV